MIRDMCASLGLEISHAQEEIRIAIKYKEHRKRDNKGERLR